MAATAAGGTGDAPEHHGIAPGMGHGPAAASPSGDGDSQLATGAYIVEQEGDLNEYGLSLGVDLDVEAEEDLAWVVREAFNAPLPGSWTEYMDDSGRAYYIKDGSQESTWEHPMDSVYREMLALIKVVRQRHPPAEEPEREELVRHHLKEVHQRAKADLAGWNGPYASEQGEYYYNDVLKVSSWDSPVAEWEKELALRHTVLSRYLLPEQASGSSRSPAEAGGAEGDARSHNMLQALRLQLGNLQREPGAGHSEGGIPEPSTSRSYHTARSHCSSRSGRSKHKDKKERKEDRASGRSSEERRAEREARRAAAAAEAVPEGLATTHFPHAD